MARKVLHVTSLTKFNVCPFNYKHDKDEVKVDSTYKWDILNIAVLNPNVGIWPFMNWYLKNVDWDFKTSMVMHDVVTKAREYIKEVKKEAKKNVWQECKMVIRYLDYDIVGTPDFVYKDKSWYHIVDFKFSTHSYYMHEDVMKYDMQAVIYPLMVMEVLDPECEKVSFTFRVYDKWNGNVKENTREITKQEARDRFKDVMLRYMRSTAFDEYPSCQQRKCYGMCSLKDKCPAFTNAK